MQGKFYTVRFQFPLLWKAFIVLNITLFFFLAFVPQFRKVIYQAFPIKVAAVIFNSERVGEFGKSASNCIESSDGSIYISSKSKLISYDGTGNKELIDSKKIRDLNGGKYQSINVFRVLDGKIFIVDWFGSVYSNLHGDWQKVYTPEKKNFSTNIHFHKGQFYLIYSKKLLIFDKGFKLQKTEFNDQPLYSSTHFKGNLFLLKKEGLLKRDGDSWKKVFHSPDFFANGIFTNKEHLILYSRKKGLTYLDEHFEVTSNELPGKYFDAYAKDEHFEVVTAYKEGFFVRQKGKEWIQFPSPGKTKSRTGDIVLNNGHLWMPCYGSGMFKVDLLRLLELENY